MSTPRDLIVLVADRNMQAIMQGLLSRSKALRIRHVDAQILRHPESDAGCCRRGVAYLAEFSAQYKHALLMFEYEGCGQEGNPPIVLEQQLEQAFMTTRWKDGAAVIVIQPELEIWVWSDSPHVEDTLGWRGRTPDLRLWLEQKKHLAAHEAKPRRPKEAMEAALREVRKPRSSSIYRMLAENVSVERCRDRAFLRLRETLHRWFSQ